MKLVVVFLSGIAATLAGAFIRSCVSDVPAAFAASWCGKAPPHGLLAASHAHCAGCVIAFTGMMMVGAAIAAWLIRWNAARLISPVRA